MRLNVKQGIYLAGLLHDIGKFWQRATKGRETLSNQTRKLENHICPVWDGRASHKHALWTSEFFAAFEKVIPQQFEYEGEQHSLSDLSARHHKRDSEQTGLERIVSYADKLSSGQDRRPDEEGMDTSRGEKQYPFKKIPLQSIFDNLFDIKMSNERSWHQLKPLSTGQAVFAENRTTLERDLQPDYEKLWNNLEKEVRKLTAEDYMSFSTTLLSLLEKYTWCIPSSTIDQPDVSLFDHLKTTGVIARCLYDSVETKGLLPKTFDGLKCENKERLTLFAGDFSGIQSFIYQITSKGAAKTLKGRSFYLQLITDVILTKILDIFDVDEGHILLSSGGGFHVLLPNDSDKISKAIAFIDDINLKMRELCDGKLYVAAAALNFGPKRLLNEKGYSSLIEKSQNALELEKNKRHKRTLNAEFFEPQPLKATTAADICKVTGMDLSEDQKASDDLLDGDGAVSKTVANQITLGKELRNAAVMLKYEGQNAGRSDEFSPFNQQITYTFLTEGEVADGLLQKLAKKSQLKKVTWLNNLSQFLGGNKKDVSYASTFSFYGAAWAPEKTYDHKSQSYQLKDGTPEFSDIAFDGGRNNDLGILRMDVDNLGKTFKEGFSYEGEKIRASISRVSTLSRMMNWFFGGYLHHLMTEKLSLSQRLNAFGEDVEEQTDLQEIRNHILPIYAGGDDLFIVTRWDIAPILAKQIRQDFRAFTGREMTISGGIAVTPEKYPIHKGAGEAGEAESRAKELESEDSNTQEKDAICYFKQPLDWHDFNLTVEQVEHLVQIQHRMGDRSLTGFLRRLTGDFILDDCRLYGKWRWRAAYQLKRMGQRNNDEISKQLVQFGASLFTGTIHDKEFQRTENYEFIDVIPMITRWVQNLTRKS